MLLKSLRVRRVSGLGAGGNESLRLCFPRLFRIYIIQMILLVLEGGGKGRSGNMSGSGEELFRS